MRKRLITSLGLAAIGLPAILFGGIFYYLLMGTFLIGAAWEYVQLFHAVKLEPQMYITVGGVILITFTRMFFPQFALPVFEAAILVALAYHLIAYERGRDQAALDFAITPGALELFDELDYLVAQLGGRLYLTKDVRMKKEVFEKGYQNLPSFIKAKKKYDPQKKFLSLQSRRIGIL